MLNSIKFENNQFFRRRSESQKPKKYNLPLRKIQTLQLDSHSKKNFHKNFLERKNQITLEERKNIEEKWIRKEEEVKKQITRVNRGNSNELENLLICVVVLILYFIALLLTPNQYSEKNNSNQNTDMHNFMLL